MTTIESPTEEQTKEAPVAAAAESAQVRKALEPRVMSGKGSPEEVRLLRSACKAQTDVACVEKINKLYP